MERFRDSVLSVICRLNSKATFIYKWIHKKCVNYYSPKLENIYGNIVCNVSRQKGKSEQQCNLIG